MIISAIVRTYEDEDVGAHKVPLIMLGAMIAVALALTASVSFGFFERQAIPSEIRVAEGTEQVDTRPIKFFDEADGTVRVEDSVTGEEVGRFGPGTGGFVRQTARSLVHKRQINKIGPEVAFDLIEWDNGDLTLSDSTTGETVELAYFGKDNRKVFADMLIRGDK